MIRPFLLSLILTGFLILTMVLIVDDTLAGAARDLSPDTIEFFRAITTAGQSQWYLVPSGLLTLAGLAIWFFTKSAFWKRFTIYVSFVFVTVASSGIVVNILKPLFARARPHEFLRHKAHQPVTEGFFNWPHIMQGKLDYVNSFPSGHTTTIIALALAFSFLLPPRNRQIGLVFMAIAAIIAASRVIIGAHYLSDVIGGMFVAFICCYGWRALYQKKFPEFPRTRTRR